MTDEQYKAIIQKKGQYRVIYADPPWYTPNKPPTPRILVSKWASDYINLMRDKDIINMGTEGCIHTSEPNMPLPPVKELQADNGVLFLWCIASKMLEGIETLQSWGYKFIKVGFVWIKTSAKTGKPKPVMSVYTHTCVEYCLLGVRGKGQLPTKRGIPDAQCFPRLSFAEKPPEFRELIDAMYPDGERLELFARHTTPGWDVWGDEVGKLDEPHA